MERSGSEALPDPYEAFGFRVKWEGRCVAGVMRVRGLAPAPDVAARRRGGGPGTLRPVTGGTGGVITLEAGVTLDAEFEGWASQSYGSGAGLGEQVVLKDLRKDLTIERVDELGVAVVAYKVFGCVVSEYEALPEPEAGPNAVSIQTLELQHEGWERDPGVAEPSEPDVAGD